MPAASSRRGDYRCFFSLARPLGCGPERGCKLLDTLVWLAWRRPSACMHASASTMQGCAARIPDAISILSCTRARCFSGHSGDSTLRPCAHLLTFCRSLLAGACLHYLGSFAIDASRPLGRWSGRGLIIMHRVSQIFEAIKDQRKGEQCTADPFPVFCQHHPPRIYMHAPLPKPL